MIEAWIGDVIRIAQLDVTEAGERGLSCWITRVLGNTNLELGVLIPQVAPIAKLSFRFVASVRVSLIVIVQRHCSIDPVHLDADIIQKALRTQRRSRNRVS